MLLNYLLLWLKLLVIVFVVNLLITILINIGIYLFYKKEIDFKNHKLLLFSCQFIFVAINTMIYVYFLNLALSSFEVESLTRLQILSLFIPIYSSNKLLNSVKREYLGDIYNIKIENFDYEKKRETLNQIVIAKSLNIALGIPFWINLILLFNPTFQNKILNVFNLL